MSLLPFYSTTVPVALLFPSVVVVVRIPPPITTSWREVAFQKHPFDIPIDNYLDR